MIDLDIMNHLKTDLQIRTETGEDATPEDIALDAYLKTLIQTAQENIADMGITLEGSVRDRNLVEQYAAYLYRSRKGDASEMPRSLRAGLNDRLFSRKMRA